MSSKRTIISSTTRRVLVVLVVALAVAIVAVVRVPTHLGVKVVEAARERGATGQLDLKGREYLWRIWWRARDDFITVDASWLLNIVLFGLLVAFVGSVVAAIRLCLLFPDDTPARAHDAP